MVSFAEFIILVLVVAVGIACWLVFTRNSDEKKDE